MIDESIGGCSRITVAMEEFVDCLQVSELDDLRFSGFLHTWCNKRGDGCISKKLDRVLVNNEWLVKFEHSEAMFLPPSISDHCPSVIKLGLPAKAALDACQLLLDLHPLDTNLSIREKELINSYTLTLQAEEDLLRQKFRIQWLKAGDRNSSYFFKAINGRRNRSKIHSISGDDGSLIEGDIPVKNEAIRHFQNILGCTMPTRHGIGTLSNIIDNVISNDQADLMNRDVTNDEIREVCFSLHPNKAPGPDSFNAHFFKKTWDIVGEDVINAIQEFFRSGHLLKELNATIISLVPKVPNPSMMKDFRPIFCCNTLYKIIAKIITNRIKPCLPDIISPSQSAFVAGRSIGDNILLAQELMRNYHTDIGCPRLALKVDLMKAFDMVDWGFLLETLAAFHFQPRVIKWIKACLTTPKFSISLNGELAGFFSGKRGLRQGDPMTPYLFVIAMEVLSKILVNRIADSHSFKFHWKCDEIKLSHLCFADDLIMLCHGSPSSAHVLKAALDELSLLSGLLANHAKSNIFTSGLSSSTTNQQLINLFGYTVGSLPIRCLGIPIISTKLCLRDCSSLVDKVSGRLSSWLNRGGTSLWFDNWHPDGPLLLKWSPHVVYDSGLPINAAVNTIVLGDSWRWPVAMSIDLVEIRSRMPTYNPNSDLEDSIRWLPSSNGIYSASSALASLKAPHPLVPWFKLVWFPQNIPRMSFILWMAVRGKLSTRDRIHKYDPLFLECSFSRAIWT
ncbi:hypothetical protein LWI28_012433 [Acer negundo]|uniref:Reverse transcriptase domain-containing protein n=1 Tax=Acer negundo TaxID=4023 RepID=A0AAD5IQY7_ACENE|nr:hypothetical protein LWI28_012433 [Acer negundo]